MQITITSNGVYRTFGKPLDHEDTVVHVRQKTEQWKYSEIIERSTRQLLGRDAEKIEGKRAGENIKKLKAE